MKEVIFSEEELRKKCLEWQKILRLQDWDIRTSIARQREFNTTESNAEIKVNLQHRIAFLRVIDPIDYNDIDPQDMEKDLVHELLHIHLWPVTEGATGPLEDVEEQAINMIAGSLIQLYRK